MRSFENPEVIKTFINWVIWIYVDVTNTILFLILIISLISFIICLVLNTESTKKITAKLCNFKLHFKQRYESVKTRFTKEKVIEISKKRFLMAKPYLRKCRYLVIGYALLWLARVFVRLFFWLINQSNISLPQWFSDVESELLWKWGLYAIIFFIIAPIFITYCFWNKFVRNIWILIYILWICLLFLWWFLALWCPAI